MTQNSSQAQRASQTLSSAAASTTSTHFAFTPPLLQATSQHIGYARFPASAGGPPCRQRTVNKSRTAPPRSSSQTRPYFEHLGALGPDMTRTGRGGLILSIWTAWSQMRPERASEVPFRASGLPRIRYNQYGAQRAYLEHLGALAPDVARTGLRGSVHPGEFRFKTALRQTLGNR